MVNSELLPRLIDPVQSLLVNIRRVTPSATAINAGWPDPEIEIIARRVVGEEADNGEVPRIARLTRKVPT
jgi:hypothetical protein